MGATTREAASKARAERRRLLIERRRLKYERSLLVPLSELKARAGRSSTELRVLAVVNGIPLVYTNGVLKARPADADRLVAVAAGYKDREAELLGGHRFTSPRPAPEGGAPPCGAE